MSLKVTYIGHATLLIEWDGLNILTDPVFSKRVFGVFKRLAPLAYDPTTLPKLDAILLSHAHYDHLDLPSFKYISSEVPILIPEGMSGAIASFVNNPVIELTTWSKYNVAPDCEICAVPAMHPGGRLIIPYRYTKCHGYMISKNGETVYFTGDTGYDSHFSNWKDLFKIKLAFLPMARIRKKWFQGKNRHLDLEELIQCWQDLGQPDWIPIHWGVFFRSSNHGLQAAEYLKRRAEPDPLLKEKMHLLQPGEFLKL